MFSILLGVNSVTFILSLFFFGKPSAYKLKFNILDKPIKFINIEFDGVCTILMSYLSVGEPEFGMKVVPIFKTQDPTFTIVDLSWVPVGTAESELPQGFSF